MKMCVEAFFVHEFVCRHSVVCLCMQAETTNKKIVHPYVHCNTFRPFFMAISGFGVLEVACWPLVPKFAVSNPTEAVGFFQGKKNPQHAFLRKGSKAVCPMS